jgi:hypothetical protein
MDMKVRYSLTRSQPVIDADVICGGVGLFIEHTFCFIKRSQKGFAFCGRCFKDRLYMPFWDDESVAGRDWITIPYNDREIKV